MNKRVLSFRDITDSSADVVKELNKFKESDSSSEDQPQTTSRRKSCIEDTVPFSVKYSVSKDTTEKSTVPTMSAAVMSTNIPQVQINPPVDGDPAMLDQALSSIRLRLVRNSCT